MKQAEVTVPWNEGLHLKPAARLVRLTQKFQSQIRLRLGSKIADARSILSILLLAATCSAPLTIQAEGDDELEAISSITMFFMESGGSDPLDSNEEQR